MNKDCSSGGRDKTINNKKILLNIIIIIKDNEMPKLLKENMQHL